jgi:non-lysosomal glucosylceramidase
MEAAMDRRGFLKGVSGGAASLLARPGLCVQPDVAALPARLIPEDKGCTPDQLASWKRRGQRRVYRGPSLYAIGMPVGGICAGQLYILGDGTLGQWHVDGRLNPTGYGSANYRPRRPARQLEQGFAVRVESAGNVEEAVLAATDHGGSFDAVEFIGEYPVAQVTYARTGEPFPLDVTLRAYSPFCPLDARDSAIPCTVLRFSVANRTTAPARVSLNGWLQNGVEFDDADDQGPVERVNSMSRDGPVTTVTMSATAPRVTDRGRPDRAIADFEGDEYKGWTATGGAFGSAPARGARPNQNPVSGYVGKGLVNSFVEAETTAAGDRPTGTLTSDEFIIDRRFLAFRIGGGSHKARTCMNLLVAGAVVRSSTGRDSERLEPRLWDLAELEGRTARLQIVDAESGPWGHVNVDDIRLTDSIPDDLVRPRPDSLGNGTMCLAVMDPHARAAAHWAGPRRFDFNDASTANTDAPVGIVGTRFDLAPGAEREVVFIVAWCFPNLHTGHGRMYSQWFEDAPAVVRYAAEHDARLRDQTELFRRTYYEGTTLPWWLVLRLMMPTANLATGTAQWWKNGRFWGWEGVGCCHGTCTHVWNYSHAEARLFPELARSTRLMQDLDAAFDPATGRVAFRGEVRGGFDYAADGQAGTILKCYREHLCCRDDSFLKAAWPRTRQALEFLILKDAEVGGGEPDGVIQGIQHNTYDINFVGANTFVGSLYLAALLAGAAMADRMNDPAFAARCRALAAAGREWTERNLFNGEYFIQQPPPDAGADRWQYTVGCLSDQLFGQTWSRLLDLGTLYDPAKVRSALRAVYTYNFAPPGGSLAQYNAAFPAERDFATGREGGLFICTWPRGGRPREPVRYRDEVWTGIEYQAAAGMLCEGLIDEALAIIRAVDDRYDGALHNPWNEVECGDHYARAMAAWGAYQALCGFIYDGPAGVIGMDPRLSPDDFAAFFVAAAGWGTITQRRVNGLRSNRIDLAWGTLDVSRVVITPPPGDRPGRVRVTRGGEALAAHLERDGSRIHAVLDARTTLLPGQVLDIAWDD